MPPATAAVGQTAVRHIAILGAGNAGKTFAAHLRRAPGVEQITLYDYYPQYLEAIAARGNRVRARGAVGGPAGTEAPIDRLSADAAAAVADADLIIIAAVQEGLVPLGQAVAPAVTPAQTLLIGSGALGAAWELRAALRTGGCRELPAVGEFNILPYATKQDGSDRGAVWVRSIKQALYVAFASPPAAPLLNWLQQVYPALTIGDDPLQTGLVGVNTVVHPAIALSNLDKMEKGAPWLFFADGVTPAVGALMEAVDADRLAVAARCRVEEPTMLEFLMRAYPPFDGAQPRSLYEWVRSRLRSRRGQVHLEAVAGPTSLQTRLIEEDVPYGLTPLEALGQLVGVPTPAVSGLIDKANAVMGVDYRATGRSLAVIGDELQAALARRGL